MYSSHRMESKEDQIQNLQVFKRPDYFKTNTTTPKGAIKGHCGPFETQ